MTNNQCNCLVFNDINLSFERCDKIISINNSCSYHIKCKNILTIDNLINSNRLFQNDNFNNFNLQEIKKKINACNCKITLIKTLNHFSLPCFKNIKENKKKLINYFIDLKKDDNKDIIKEKKCIIIQKNYRGYIIRKINKLLGFNNLKKISFVNDEDIMSCDNYIDIPLYYTFILESNSKFYFFDLRTFYKFYKINIKNSEIINPYTQLVIPNHDILRFKKLINLYKIKNINLNYIDDKKPENNSIEEINELAFNVFQKIDLLGYYTNSDWFLELDIIDLKRFYKYMEDIWNYRAQLTLEKQNDIRPDKNSFYISVGQFYCIRDKIKLQKILLNEIMKFITLSNNRSDRFNAATYVLVALGMVSKNANRELPEWIRYNF